MGVGEKKREARSVKRRFGGKEPERDPDRTWPGELAMAPQAVRGTFGRGKIRDGG